MEPFGLTHYRQAVHATTELALQTDKDIVETSNVLDSLRHRRSADTSTSCTNADATAR